MDFVFLEMQQTKEENKILFRDVNSTHDPNIRAYVEREQAQISEKMPQQQHQQTLPISTSFGPIFNDLGGSGSRLPDY